jgi:predicted HTH transcriptional regulator
MENENQNDWLKNILEIPAETQTIEFKRLSEDKVTGKIVETVVAMANTDGGVIILGIDDPEKTRLKGFGRIYGIDENIQVYDALARELQRIIPPLSGLWPPIFLEVPDSQKRVALLFVPKAIDSFRSVNNHVYVRGEKGNRQLTAGIII